MLPLLLLLLLPAVLPPVHLHGLGGPGLPDTSRAVRQSHGRESDNLQSRGARLLHQVPTRPFPMGPAGISPEVCWWGLVSLWWAGRRPQDPMGGTRACPGDRGRLQALSLARPPTMGCPPLRSRPWLPLHSVLAPPRGLSKAFPSPASVSRT